MYVHILFLYETSIYLEQFFCFVYILTWTLTLTKNNLGKPVVIKKKLYILQFCSTCWRETHALYNIVCSRWESQSTLRCLSRTYHIYGWFAARGFLDRSCATAYGNIVLNGICFHSQWIRYIACADVRTIQIYLWYNVTLVKIGFMAGRENILPTLINILTGLFFIRTNLHSPTPNTLVNINNVIVYFLVAATSLSI